MLRPPVRYLTTPTRSRPPSVSPAPRAASPLWGHARSASPMRFEVRDFSPSVGRSASPFRGGSQAQPSTDLNGPWKDLASELDAIQIRRDRRSRDGSAPPGKSEPPVLDSAPELPNRTAASPAARATSPFRQSFDLPCPNCEVHLTEVSELKHELQAAKRDKEHQYEAATLQLQRDLKQLADSCRTEEIAKDEQAVAHVKEIHSLTAQLDDSRHEHTQALLELDRARSEHYLTRAELEQMCSELNLTRSELDKSHKEQEIVKAELDARESMEAQRNGSATAKVTKLEAELDLAHGLLEEQQRTAVEACAQLRQQTGDRASKQAIEQERAQAAREIAVLKESMEALEAEHNRKLEGALQRLEESLRTEMVAEADRRLMSQAQATLAAEAEIDRLTEYLSDAEAAYGATELALEQQRADQAEAEVVALRAEKAADEALHATALHAVRIVQEELEVEVVQMKRRAGETSSNASTTVQEMQLQMKELAMWKKKATAMMQEQMQLKAHCQELEALQPHEMLSELEATQRSLSIEQEGRSEAERQLVMLKAAGSKIEPTAKPVAAAKIEVVTEPAIAPSSSGITNRLSDLKAWAECRVAEADQLEVEKAHQLIQQHSSARFNTALKTTAVSEAAEMSATIDLVTHAAELVSRAEMDAGSSTSRELQELARLRQRKREVFIQSQTVSRKVVLSEELAAKKALSRT